MTVDIRLITGEELLTSSFPLSEYAFEASPQSADTAESPRRRLATRRQRRTHVAFDDGTPAATATVIPTTQHVRGRIVSMGGVASVATDPRFRRRGHARSLVTHVLSDMRAQGHAVSALYPFRPSFYQRFGYVSLPQPATARLRPDELTGLLAANLTGTVTYHRWSEAFDEYWEFVSAMQRTVFGMALRPYDDAADIARHDDAWLAVARVAGEVSGALVYRISGFGGTLQASAFFYRDSHARTLLLQWLARHADQVTEVVLPVPPDATPELWHTDLTVTVERRTAIPDHNPPMARVLDVTALAGMRVGAGAVAVRVVDELLPDAAGVYTFDGDGGELVVRRGGEPSATLTPNGLAGLVYGVLDPDELALRGFGEASPKARETLRALFPRRTPYLYERF